MAVVDALTVSVALCPVCGGNGSYRQRNLRDHLFGSAGNWHMRQCDDRGCGVLWLDPAPANALLPELYKNYYTHSEQATAETPMRRLFVRARHAYLTRRFGYPDKADGMIIDRLMGLLIGLLPSRRDYFDLAAFYTPFIPAGRLLEIGCGSGVQLAELARRGWIVTGLDADPNAVRQAAGKGFDVMTGTLDAANFADASFDVIAMIHVIEHVTNLHALMVECRRVLKPGGRLVIVTPNAASWGARCFGPDWRGLEPPRHIQVLTPAAAEMLMTIAGFDLRRLFTTQRDARNIFRKSLEIRCTRTNRGYLPDWLIRTIGWMAEAVGRIALLAWPRKGEELCVIARKPLREST